MSKKLEKFYKTEEGKKVLKENLKKLYEDFKNKKDGFLLRKMNIGINFEKRKKIRSRENFY